MTVTSLRTVGGPELLWSIEDPEPPGTRGDTGAETLAATFIGGWFEMNPDAGSPLDSTRQYHGESVRRSWHVEESTSTSLRARIDAVTATLTMTRGFELLSDRLVASSSVTNVGREPLVIAHGEHPCFRRAAFAGGALEVTGDWADERRPAFTIPADGDGTSGNALIVPRSDAVRLAAADGGAVSVVVDATAHPQIGLWWNYAPGTHDADPKSWDCLAIEPLRPPVRLEPGDVFTATTAIVVHPR